MPGTYTFKWNKDPVVSRVNGAAERTMQRVGQQAAIWWFAVVPVGKNTKRHRAGELRDSWFLRDVRSNGYFGIVFGASAPYAIYVELGTSLQPPQAPVRTVAGEAFPFIEIFLAQELS